MAAVVNYSPPWWVNLLHRLPHFNMEFQIVSSDFRPEDSEYQKVRQAPVVGGGVITSHSECVILCIVRRHLITPPAVCPHCCFHSRLAKWWRKLSRNHKVVARLPALMSVRPKTSPIPVLLTYCRNKCGSVMGGKDQDSFRNRG